MDTIDTSKKSIVVAASILTVKKTVNCIINIGIIYTGFLASYQLDAQLNMQQTGRNTQLLINQHKNMSELHRSLYRDFD